MGRSFGLLLALALLPPDGRAGETVAVALLPRSAAIPCGETRLVRGFAFLPPGLLAAADAPVHLRTRARAELPTEARATGFYPDGSVRALCLSGLVPPALVAAGASLELAAGPGPAPRRALAVLRGREGVRVDTGVLVLLAAARGPDLFPVLEVGRVALRPAHRPARLVAAVGTEAFSSEFEENRGASVVHQGLLECVVRVAGALADGEGEPHAAYHLLLTFHAGSPLVEMALDVESFAADDLADDLRLELPLNAGRSARVSVLGKGTRLDCGAGPASVAALDGQTLLASAAGVCARIDAGSRAGLLIAGERGAGVALVASRLRPNAPRLLEGSAAGGLKAVLQAGPFFFGEERGMRIDLALAAAGARDWKPLEPALLAEPLPQLCGMGCAGLALPGRRPLAAGTLGIPDEPLARLLAAADAAVSREVGFRDYGDYRHLGGWANLEYDPAAAFLLSFLGNGDARHALVARDMLNHWVRYDRSAGEIGAPAGFPWMHGRDHRSLEHELGHVWAEGLVLARFLFGDRAYGAAALELRDSLTGLAREEGELHDERSFGWALLALHDLLLLEEDAGAAGAARELAERLIGLQDERGFFRIDHSDDRADAEFAPAPWVTAGITVEALYRHFLRCGEERTRLALGAATDFLLNDARWEDGEFASRVLYGPRLASGLGQDGRVGAVDRLMIAAGLGRAALLDLRPGARAVFEETLLRAGAGIATARLDGNQAARALVALRSLADTCSLLSARP
ncbi:MAG: hypothetical protein HY812_13380 [Planctomycetes bacterium]|nr:hypothetical protein [Planctomycetota bacterium]